MDTSLCKLTITCPRTDTKRITDALDGAQPAIPRYVVVEAVEQGHDTALPSAAERVSGARKISLLTIVLPKGRVEPLIELVRNASSREGVAYWVEPVADFGRLVR